MKLYNISLNSLWRRKARMFFLLVGLLIAVSTVVILLNISQTMNSDIANKLDEYGANILIVPLSDELSLSYGGMTVSGVSFDVKPLQQVDISKIKQIKNKDNIKIISPKLLNVTDIQQKKVMVVGVDFEQELALKKWWSIIGKAPREKDEALIGAEVKKKLNLGLDQAILINGEPFKIKGILEESGSQDDQLVLIDLNRAQQLFKKESAISLIEVAALCYDCPIEEIVAQTSEQLPGAKVTAIQQTIKTKMKSINQFENFSMGISIVILLVAGLIVFTTMSASVNERKREIGIFRAIGYRRSHIIQIILQEALLLSSIAGVFGYFFGLLISIFAAPMIGADSVSISINFNMIALSLLISTFIGIGASLYPSIKASRLDPTIALQSI
ncbi:MAG: ABC transporter permease [Calditrichaeota bacterium]|nr:MAG: ABC transporter permease [Calditrichota bacterium]MBL1207200.1 ABC transporter permease [Calditrichota bacterium]NOG47033.1 ABC transporter permease [Calditrichota bacterium]